MSSGVQVALYEETQELMTWTFPYIFCANIPHIWHILLIFSFELKKEAILHCLFRVKNVILHVNITYIALATTSLGNIQLGVTPLKIFATL